MPTFKNIVLNAAQMKESPLTVNKRYAILAKHATLPGGKFLDCGCGVGTYVRVLCQKAGLDAYGIEYEQGVVDSIQSDDWLKERVTQGDVQVLKYSDQALDYAMLNEVLEHVADDRKALREVYRVLKPGGLLFMFSPNRWFPFETHGVTLKITGKRTYGLPFVPYLPLGVGKIFYETWARNYGQNQLKTMLEEAGFVILERTYIWPTFENRSGRQPRIISSILPAIRLFSKTAEKTFFLRRFGVSQVFICQKKPSR